MFGFHKRNRSLIPVADLEKTEKREHSQLMVCVEEQYEDDETDMALETSSPRHSRNRIMIYLLFLAEATMAASFSSQIAVLAPTTDASCFGPDASFLRSILESAYLFGSTLGVLWGWTSDRWGRRKTALSGLVAMSLCCLAMGFARSFAAIVVLRFVAGALGAAVTVAGLTMLADTTHGSRSRVAVVARLPFVMVAGSLGPLAASSIDDVLDGLRLWPLEVYPGLASQIICGSIILTIAVVEILLLKETLPDEALTHESDENNLERMAFMSLRANESCESVDSEMTMNSSNSTTPSLSTSHMISAPAIAILLASFSILLLHSSTFDLLVLELSHFSLRSDSTNIPCSWVDLVAVAINALAAIHVMRHIPKMVTKTSVLSTYRSLSLTFPALYIVVPATGVLLGSYQSSPVIITAFSCIAMSVKAVISNAANVLVLLLILSAAPDASTTGKMVGVMYLGQFFSALAVGICGLSYYASDQLSFTALNGSLWGGSVAVAVVGVGITWKLREKPRVGTDIPEECLVWEDMFDSESDHGMD